MVEPTESESKEELDRFVDAMNSIFEEIKEIESGVADPVDNVLKNAPHTPEMLTANEWDQCLFARKSMLSAELVTRQ